MTYKGFRIDRKCNVFDLNDKLVAEKVGNVVMAKEFIDQELEKMHKKAEKEDKEKEH